MNIVTKQEKETRIKTTKRYFADDGTEFKTEEECTKYETDIKLKHLAEKYKPKWHKVADGDYPPCERGNYSINVLIDCGDIAYYNYDDECWVVEPSSAEIDPPVAWCEIPKFEGQ